MAQSFTKNERLCSKALTEHLFSDGQRIMVFPYSVRYELHRADALPMPVQVLIMAPKRKFRHAVDRNRVKRLTREAYRRQKESLYDALQARQLSMTLALTYIHTEIFDYNIISRKVAQLIEQLIGQLDKATLSPDDSGSAHYGTMPDGA